MAVALHPKRLNGGDLFLGRTFGSYAYAVFDKAMLAYASHKQSMTLICVTIRVIANASVSCMPRVACMICLRGVFLELSRI